MLAALDRLRRDARVAALLRIVLGALFLYAGAIKAFAPDRLAEDIANYHLLPGWLVPPIAVTLPWIELIAGLCLIVGVWGRGAAWLVAGLMAVFTGALSQALLRGIDLACGCFGGDAPADGLTIARDLILLAVSLHVAASDRGVFGIARRLDGHPPVEAKLHG